MQNPLDAFKQTFFKEVQIMGKTFIFDTSKPIKTLNKVEILINTLVSVEKVNLEDFSNIKESLDKGLSLENAKKEEIESWEPEIIELLVKKYITLLKEQKPIDFKNLPDLRIYWKIRQIFSKEEVDNWGNLEYQWAIHNIQEDFKEKDEFDERALERRKPWYSVELYNHLNKKEQEKNQEEQENKLLIQKIMEQQGIDSNKFEIELVDEELPIVIEEDK